MEERSYHHSNSVTPILPQQALFLILCIKGFRFAYIYSCEQASVDYQKLKIRTYSHAGNYEAWKVGLLYHNII